MKNIGEEVGRNRHGFNNHLASSIKRQLPGLLLSIFCSIENYGFTSCMQTTNWIEVIS